MRNRINRIKNIVILGSTGSIGVTTLKVIQEHSDKFKVFALAAGKNWELLYRQIAVFRPRYAILYDFNATKELKARLNNSYDTEVLYGPEGYKKVVTEREVDLVVAAISGSSGLIPTIAAIDAGKDIALANKEVMVMAGEFITNVLKQKGNKIIPIDSEHCAIFQCLLGQRKKDVKSIILTASGGPFLKRTKEDLAYVTPEEALNHPKWNMGKKNSIDSATLMNKGLEVIEARWLFNVDFERIKVHIHPQSIVHSLVEFIDGSIIAQLSIPDMKIPISYALSFPKRLVNTNSSLNLFTAGPLEFYPPDLEKFPGLRLAYEAGRKGGPMPAVLNAANEVAVEAFIAGKITFPQITEVIEDVLTNYSWHQVSSLEDILMAHDMAKKMARKFVGDCLK